MNHIPTVVLTIWGSIKILKSLVRTTILDNIRMAVLTNFEMFGQTVIRLYPDIRLKQYGIRSMLGSVCITGAKKSVLGNYNRSEFKLYSRIENIYDR